MSRERRVNPRRYTEAEAVIRWMDSKGSPTACVGIVRDYSRTGLRLDMGRPVALGSSLSVRVNGHQFAGAVRYCTPAQSHYSVGIEF